VVIRRSGCLGLLEALPRIADLLPLRLAYRDVTRQLGLEFGVLFGDPLLPCEALRRDSLLRTAKRGFGVGEPAFELILSSSGVADLRGDDTLACREVTGRRVRVGDALGACLLERRNRRVQPLLHGVALTHHSLGSRSCIRLMSGDSVGERGRVVDSLLFGRTERVGRFIQPGLDLATTLRFGREPGLQFVLTEVRGVRGRSLRRSPHVNLAYGGVPIGERPLETSDRRFSLLQLGPEYAFPVGKLLRGGDRIREPTLTSLLDRNDRLTQSFFSFSACCPMRLQLLDDLVVALAVSLSRLASEQSGVSPKTVQPEVDGSEGRSRLGDVVARAELEGLDGEFFIPFRHDDDRHGGRSRSEVPQNGQRVGAGVPVFDQENVKWKSAVVRDSIRVGLEYFNGPARPAETLTCELGIANIKEPEARSHRRSQTHAHDLSV